MFNSYLLLVIVDKATKNADLSCIDFDEDEFWRTLTELRRILRRSRRNASNLGLNAVSMFAAGVMTLDLGALILFADFQLFSTFSSLSD